MSGGISKKGIVLAALLLGVLAAALLAGYIPRRDGSKALATAAAMRRITPPLVNAARVTRAAKATEVSFPGNITPVTEAYIFARATGYLKRRLVDIGDRVSEGQLLAEIDAPDLDEQVTQAQAALSQSESQLGQAEATLQQLIATRDLAEVTWKRYQVLTATGAVSRQAGDAQLTTAKTSEANVTAGEKSVVAARDYVRASLATLNRLKTLQGYERVTSPFSGVVTARNVDIGALISATGSSQGPMRANQAAPFDVPTSGEIFRVAQIGTLRVLVSLPQIEAAGIQVGQAANVSVEALPNQLFPGRITRYLQCARRGVANASGGGSGPESSLGTASWNVRHGAVPRDPAGSTGAGSRCVIGGGGRRHVGGTAPADQPCANGESLVRRSGRGGFGPHPSGAFPKGAAG